MQLLFYYPIKTFCPLQSEYSAATEQFYWKASEVTKGHSQEDVLLSACK